MTSPLNPRQAVNALAVGTAVYHVIPSGFPTEIRTTIAGAAAAATFAANESLVRGGLSLCGGTIFTRILPKDTPVVVQFASTVVAGTCIHLGLNQIEQAIAPRPPAPTPPAPWYYFGLRAPAPRPVTVFETLGNNVAAALIPGQAPANRVPVGQAQALSMNNAIIQGVQTVAQAVMNQREPVGRG